MDLSHVIIGPVTTEKSERLKGQQIYTLRVHSKATKIDVKGAIRRYFDCTVTGVRISWVGGKTRIVGRNRSMQKRSPYKKALVTLAPKSKTLDLASFKTS